MSEREGFPAHRLEYLEGFVRITAIQEQCRCIGIPQPANLCIRRWRDRGEGACRPPGITGIEPFLDRKKRQPVPLSTTRLCGKVCIDLGGFGVLAIAREAFGPGFARPAATALETSRLATGERRGQQRQGGEPCNEVPGTGTMYSRICHAEHSRRL